MPRKPVAPVKSARNTTPKPQPKTRLATLEQIRDELESLLFGETACRSCSKEFGEPPAAKAQLAKELRAVLVEIDELRPPEVTSAVDDLAAARASRLANAHVSGSSVRRVRQRDG